MFLKYVDIKGFKSFSDKTEIIFNSGITAIVGPNGSGKSNISDAIRWVLGEQSVKALRGDKMEDVIFAGTAFRKPINVCEVSLCFDNNSGTLPIEFNEVLVKRRLYRDGDSEYYINNIQCRLKDVNALFMDTGIGKEGYSLIGQGKIDAILSGKPDERRGVIEEASGIVKLKWRKEEALKKIQNYDNNLVRLNDIISTYEERIEPLRLESEKAKNYVNLSNELKQKDIDVKVFEVKKIQETLRYTEKFLKEKNSILNELKLERYSLKSFQDETDLRLVDIEHELNDKKTKLSVFKDKISHLSTSKLIYKEKVENIKNNLISINSEIDAKEALLEDKISLTLNEEREKDETIIEFTKLEEDLTSIERLLEDIQNDINLYDNKYSKNLSIINKTNDDLLEIRNLMLNLKNEIKFNENKLEDLSSNKEDLIKRLKKVEDDIDNLNKILNDKLETIRYLEAEIASGERNLSNLKLQRKQNNDQMNNLLREKSKFAANLQMLKKLENHYEGYNRASKAVIDFAKDSGDEFSTVLGEIIKVKEGMELAIEISLGGRISDIIVRDEGKAKEYIEYLKRTNFGRSTFLPLTILKPLKISLNENLKKMDGFIGIASDLTLCDEKYKSAILYALSRVVIVKNVDTAISIARAASFSFKIVTLFGDVVNVGGSMTGGSTSKDYGILSRKSEIKNLKIKIEDLNADILKKEEELFKLNDSIRKEDSVNKDLISSINNANIQVAELKSKIQSAKGEQNSLTMLLNRNNEDFEFIKLSLDKDKLKNLDANEREVELMRKKLKFEEEVKSIERETLELNEKKESYREAQMNHKMAEVKYKGIIANKEELIKRLNVEKGKITDELASLNNKLMVFTEEIDEKEEDLLKFEKDLERIKDDHSNLGEEIDELELKRIKLKDENNRRKAILDEKNIEICNIEDEIHKKDMVKIKCETERDNIFKNVNDEYGMTYAEILSMSTICENISELKKDISELKIEINSLGVVNVASIEEYREVNERYTFMNSQKEDMINAKEELTKLISELTNKMEVIFLENFTILRKCFDETFKELFDGGTGDLILNEEDILNGSIEINVEPPGKKLQNINLLSGGEKGLSAIALLFAILKMRPSAFCILDEIEASLDDANVVRFADYLKRLKDRTQFVIITHRKGTMEASDSLYGITMEEKGISKVVSVSLLDSQNFRGEIDV